MEHDTVDARSLLHEVRAAQVELGAGSSDDALLLVTPLLARTAGAITSLGYLTRSPAERRMLLDAFCYARVTAILALESVGAREAVPRIRVLAAESRDVAGPGTEGWKVQSAAAEMLGRCGDGEGARVAIAAAVALAPDGETYVTEVAASIRSMFPESSVE